MGLPKLDQVSHFALSNLKSCLKNTHEHSFELCDSEKADLPKETVDDVKLTFARDDMSPKREKRVTFADTQGVPLVSVKYVEESCDEPPRNLSSSDLLNDNMNNLTVSGVNPINSSPKVNLYLQFSQPAADFVKFKQKLDDNNVALENIIVKSPNCINGTIKVKNVAYHKEVFIRISFDDWTSYEDVSCGFVNNAYGTGIYDTFQFSITVPVSYFDTLNLIQFCVCFKCNSCQFWDNNAGKNYCITSSRSRSSFQFIPSTLQIKSLKLPYPSTYSELPKPEDRSWPENGSKTPFY